MVSLSYLCGASAIPYPLVEDYDITSVVQHSGEAQPGSLFFAIDGSHTSGCLWAKEAVANGAVAVISEREIPSLSVPVIVTTSIRSRFSCMCAAFWGNPHQSLTIIAVTGTDGKSTTSDYLYQILGASGLRCGLLSTITFDDGSTKRPSPYRQSTPEADRLFSFLAHAVDNGLTHVILECTSHALSSFYDRLGPITFALSIVTTVTSEHLDFHRTGQAYLDAKLNIVRRLADDGLLVTSDANPHRSSFIALLKGGQRSVIVGKDLPYTCSRLSWQGIEVATEGVVIPTPLLLPPLVSNALLALVAARHVAARPIDPAILSTLKPVKGRMEVVPNTLGIEVVIDFAHTADSYAKLFDAITRIGVAGRLIVVMGAAGERDRTKRASMGQIAVSASDILIITEEDPRSEDPDQIIDDLIGDLDATDTTIVTIPIRRQAIAWAIDVAQQGDVVLLLGKGHERSIQRRLTTIAWDERAVVRRALTKKERSL